MKKTLFILLALISLDTFCQHLKNADDSTTFKGAYVNFMALPRIGGNSLITDGIMDFDTVLRVYKSYPIKQTGIHFYDGVTDPDTTLRLNLNAKLFVGGLGCNNTTSKYAIELWNSGTGRMISGSQTGTSYFMYLSNQSTGYMIGGVNSSTGRWIYVTNSSTGYGSWIQNQGGGTAYYVVNNSAGTAFLGNLGTSSGNGLRLYNTSTGGTSGTFIKLERAPTGSTNTSQDFILITDNPTTSGTITGGKVLEVTEGTTVRLSLHPRVLKTGTPVAYQFGTYWNLTSGYLVQVNDSGVVKAQIAYNGQTDIGDIAGGNYAQIESDGEINIISGTPGHYKINGIPQSYIMEEWYTDVATSGTGETDLYSFTVPANTLNNNGDKLICSFTAIGDASALGYVEPYFAGTNLASDIVNMINSGIIKIDIEIIRVSTTVARCVITASQGGTYNYITYIELTSKDWTATNVLKITGTASTGTITAKMGYVEYKPVAQ